MTRIVLILLIACISCLKAGAQIVTGKVTDATTKEPLAYVNIGVLYQNRGTISQEDGTFSINLSSSKPDDVLVFSMIGYETIKIEWGQIKESFLAIKLVPKIYQLKEVIVKAKRIREPLKLGRYEITRFTTGQRGKEEYGFGGEWGLVIFTDGKKYNVLDVRFHIRFNTVDSVLYRVHIYSVKDGLPAESLLKKEAFVKSYKKEHWIVCNVEDQNLVIDQNVIVTYEVVRFWSKPGYENRLFFTHGAGYERGQAFSRLSSHDGWTINQSPPVALCLGVEEAIGKVSK